ncbi:recombinase family protein [Dysgonomonas termitidis]|uniref:Recombinase family protein n=1 Tax=Dysgonomonas termitidis TaxID=1516126 RepID=A0ABV9L1B6_9BACT
MNKELFKSFAKGDSASTSDITPGNAVIYNRVSTKEQEDNQSLGHQLESCKRYAERYNLNIITEPFGGVFESAKTDKERKEFNRMLTFIKRNKKLNIKYAIVWSTSRFSRTGSTVVLEDLENMGVIVLSATSNYNPKTPSGKFNQRIELANAAFDNEMKSQQTKDLGRARLLEGRWIGKAPRGYDQKTTKKQQTITINEEGKFIKKAFHWKADEKLTNQEIIQRLDKLGYHITKQKLSEVLKNPFYCGKMIHNFLNGEVVDGNHPLIISEETFLKANEMLNLRYKGGYEQKKEKQWATLLGTLKCPCCGFNVTASISTKMKRKYNREVYYYVCSRKGCKFNNQVIKVHEVFNSYLSNFSINNISKDVFEKQLHKLFNNLTKQDKSSAQQMKTQVSKLRAQLKTMENNWALEIHPKKKDILWNNIEDTEKKIVEIENEIDKHENSILNLNTYLKYAINMIYNPLKMWEEIELGDKQRLQNLIFPEGIIYNKENNHIEPLSINNFFNVKHNNTANYLGKEKGLNSEKSVKSPYVLGAGVKQYNITLFAFL